MAQSTSPPSYGSTDRPSPLPHSSSSLSARALAIRAAHRLTSPALHPEDHAHDSALSPSSIDITPPTPTSHRDGRDGALSPFSHPDDPEYGGSGGSTPRQQGLSSPYLNGIPGASIRFRPPRKSIDAGRLARQRSHQAQAQTAGSSGLSTHSSLPGSPSDRRKSSTTTGKPRYRWLSQPGGGTGDEPGVDVRSRRDEDAYGHLKGGTTVTVVDYATTPIDKSQAPAHISSDHSTGAQSPEQDDEEEEDMNVRVEFPGERLGEWLGGEGKRKLGQDGKPVGVRWVHVQGLNWEVIKTLTLHYHLHPLAVEDALRSSNSPRSKLDFYRSHLYLQLLIHHIHSSDEDAIEAALASDGAEGVIIDSDSESEQHPSVDQDQGELGTAGSAVDSGHNHTPGTGRRRPKKKGTLERMREAVMGKKGDQGVGMRLPEGVEGVFEPSVQGTKLQGGESPYQKEAHRLTVDQLSAKYMVPIRRGILSIFMTRDGTIITLTRRRFREVVNPIYERLEDDQSLLRRSADVSMLAQAFLDIAADLAVEVTQTFEAQILNLEASVLVDPQIDTVRHLHVLSSQLIRLRRSITPLLHITSNIRDQDVARSAAASAIPVKAKERGGSIISISGPNPDAATSLTNLVIPENSTNISSGPNTGSGRPAGGVPGWATPRDEPGSNRSFYPSAQGQSSSQMGPPPTGLGQSPTPTSAPGQGGYFSPLTKVYVGDVLDHLEMVVSSMDQFVATCDHLTDYVFNVLSFQTNESMERLSIVTVIFLPLTFISSFFGMNFIDFPEINQSVAYFWKVAAPSTFLFFIIFSFSYIRTFIETGWRRTQRWRSRKEAEGRFRRGNGLGVKGE